MAVVLLTWYDEGREDLTLCVMMYGILLLIYRVMSGAFYGSIVLTGISLANTLWRGNYHSCAFFFFFFSSLCLLALFRTKTKKRPTGLESVGMVKCQSFSCNFELWL